MEQATIDQALERLKETLAQSHPKSTTEPSPDESQKRLEKQQKLERWWDKWICLRCHHPHLEALKSDVFEFCVEFSRHPLRGRRLVIHGANGSGKSHTLKRVVAWANRVATLLPPLATETGFRTPEAKFLHWPQTVDLMKDGQWRILDECATVDLLALDDIGAEHDRTGFSLEKLYTMLEQREFKWTLLATNVSPENWDTRFERRIASRLMRNSIVISLDEVPDYNSL